VACEVVVEKILEAGEQCSIVKKKNCNGGGTKTDIAITILALFSLSSNFHKTKIPTVSTKSSIFIVIKFS
jgi:hypothetical protein